MAGYPAHLHPERPVREFGRALFDAEDEQRRLRGFIAVTPSRRSAHGRRAPVTHGAPPDGAPVHAVVLI
ncbi:MAG: hypothetical protein ACRDYA_18730 [Egibacteraceae bacterium]